LNFKVITLFPEFFSSPFSTGLLGKACDSEILNIDIIDLRDFSEDRLRRCDDYPYGGGSGMVIKPEPVFHAMDKHHSKKSRVLLTSPGGRPLDQDFVKELSKEEEVIIICGHYEGVDHRVVEAWVDDEVSIGDYVLSGGEFAALVIVDAAARYIPGFMSNSSSLEEESFEDHLLEYPQYTRPESFRDYSVPDVLLSGHHKKIEDWRYKERLFKTRKQRPDLYKKFILSKILGD